MSHNPIGCIGFGPGVSRRSSRLPIKPEKVDSGGERRDPLRKAARKTQADPNIRITDRSNNRPERKR